MRDWLRLAAKMQRSEAVLLLVAIAVWTGIAAILTWQLASYASAYPACFRLSASAPANCQVVQHEFAGWDQTAEVLLWSVLAIPVVIGVVLGSPLVGRELEQRTAPLIWSLALSRTRWLVMRTIPVVLAVTLLLAIVSVAGEVLTATRLGGETPGFLRFDQRGLLVVVRGLLALGCAIAVGAWLGRLLPALLVGLVVAGFAIGGIALTMNQWQRSEADVVRVQELGQSREYLDGLVLGPVVVLPDGTVTQERNIERLPEGTDFDWVQVLPSRTYWTWVIRETGLSLAVAALMYVVAVIVTRRRLPRP